MVGTRGRGFGAVCAAAVIGLAGGCTPANSGGVEDRVSAGDDLVATMEVETGDGGAVRLTLHVTNPASAPVELEFRSGQRYDFAVSRPDGTEVWRWSEDQMFTQALGSETLPAGGSLRYSVTWPSTGTQGEYIARGEVTSSNRSVSQAVRFELAGNE